MDLVDIYQEPKRHGFLNAFTKLQTEISELTTAQNSILFSYGDIRTLNPSRDKRSLIPFVGKALQFLFRTMTESDLSKVRKNVTTLSANQQEIAHILEDSISILNTSRVQISENRDNINELSETLLQLDGKLDKITRTFENQVVKLEEFVQIYLQLDLMIVQVKGMIINGRMYMEHLSSQLDMLSLGHVSPSIITPKNLKKLLLEMQSKLPYHLTLPEDPIKNLWKYYQSLTCTTVLDEDKILVIVSVPLLDRNTTFEIYKVCNAPLPYYNQSIPAQLQPDIVAQYKIETFALAINAEKTKYMLLNSDELNHCSTSLLSYCSIHSSVFPVTLSERCIVNLFMNNLEVIETVCQKEIIPNSILPKADYLFDGIWIVASQKAFKIFCSMP